MSNLEVESYLSELSADEPSGPDLEYDPAFTEMERATEGKPEQQFGDTIVEAEEPDWRSVRSLALDLLSRTHDMRVAAHLTRASLAVNGWQEFRDALAILRGFVDQFWDSVHPQLDPDDENDPTFRVNSLLTLCDRDTTLRLCQKTPLVRSRMVGQFGWRDVETARGEREHSGEGSAPNLGAIDAAFTDVGLEETTATADALAESIELVEAIENEVTRQVGASNAVQLTPLTAILRELEQFVRKQVDRLGGGQASTDESGGEMVAVEGGMISGDGSTVVVQQQGVGGKIRHREDVMKAFDLILQYYEEREPSSPVPILIERAKRLVDKGFMDIIRNLAPDGMHQVERIRGPVEEE